MSATDPLEGYRGSPQRSADTELEDSQAFVDSLRNSELNTELLRAVVVGDDLERELLEDSSSMRRLVNMLVQKIDDATKVWQSEGDPASVRALNAHRDARAARLVITWIEEIMKTAEMSEKQLEQEYENE